VESVRVFSADGQTSVVYPELPYRTETVSVDQINRGIGIAESAENIASLLTRMCLKSVAVDDSQKVNVEVMYCCFCRLFNLLVSMDISLHFNGHFPGGPG